MAQALPDFLNAEWNEQNESFEEQLTEISVLKSFYENTDGLEIMQEASKENSKLNIITIKVNVECSVKPINADMLLPIERVQRNDLNSTTQTRKLERSVSGHHATTSIKCEILPPLCLKLVLPVTYPSDNQPGFTLSCFWLNKRQLSRLCQELDNIWRDYKGMAVIYTWVEWLQMNTISCLDILEDTKLMLTPLGQYLNEDDSDGDIRAVTTFDDIDHCIYEFMRFNFVEEQKQFKNTQFTCGICFDEKFGSECFRMNLCKHVFCADCLITCCEMHVKEGTVQHLKCPESDCKEVIPEQVLQMVLSEEEYERWERLLLQRTLDSMQDVLYCPRCSMAIIHEGENDNHVYCMNCRFDFCNLCKDSFHVGLCATGEEKLYNQVKKLNLKPQELLALPDQIIKEQYKNYDFVLQLKKKTERDVQEMQTSVKLGKYKLCPKCRATIDKFEGCNKVTCICGAIFCYICNKIISGYDHFGDTRCNLWTGGVGNDAIMNRVAERQLHQGQQMVNRILDLVPGQQRNIINCPNCRQRCLKMQRNNHIKCWQCSTNFCFCCKQKIIGVVTLHFKTGSLCIQHSD